MKRKDLVKAYSIARRVPEAESRQAVDMVFAILRMALERGNGVNIRHFGEFVQSEAGVRFYQGFPVTGPDDNSNPA